MTELSAFFILNWPFCALERIACTNYELSRKKFRARQAFRHAEKTRPSSLLIGFGAVQGLFALLQVGNKLTGKEPSPMRLARLVELRHL